MGSKRPTLGKIDLQFRSIRSIIDQCKEIGLKNRSNLALELHNGGKWMVFQEIGLRIACLFNEPSERVLLVQGIHRS